MKAARKSNAALITILLSIAFASPGRLSAPTISEIRKSFVNPPDNCRPMMRWWWFGPAVTRTGLEREMKLMKEGGIGGFEVQPVYPLALDDSAAGIKTLPYLSDGFLDALRFTSEKARELGLRMDLTLGSGWPYGGAQVPVRSLWCPPYSLDVTGLMKSGDNSLRILVANTAVNHMAGRSLPDYRSLNLRYGTRFDPQDMDKIQPVVSGLFGPIRLVQ